MGNCFGGSATVPSSPPPPPVLAPTQETAPFTHPATSTPSSYVAVSSQNIDDRDNSPPSSCPHRCEMRLYPYQFRGGVSQPRNSILSTDTTSLQRRRSHSSGRVTRTSSGTGRMPPDSDRRERRPRFPPTLQSVLSNDFRFRILVVGKPGSGKSSLINTIFNVDMSRAPTNVSGLTAEFRPCDNRHLIVHECSAFGPGELQAVRDFITTRNHKSRQASERLHAIWICIPMSDVINGQFDNGLKLLLGTGVPLVIVFTMLDLIVPDVPSHGNEYEKARATAYMTWEGCRTLFGNVRAEIVSTQPRFGDMIAKLVATTDEVINGRISASSKAQRTESQMSPVTLAWSVSQRVSRGIKVQATIEVGKSRYWRRLGSSEDFAGQTLANCIEVIHSDIVGVWNLPDKGRYLSSRAFKVAMSHLIQDQSRPPIGTSSRPRPSGTQETGAAWLDDRYENRNEYICLVAAYIVNLTLILCGVFGRHGNVSPSGVQWIMNDFASSSIHAEICRFLSMVHRFEYQDNDVVLTKIIDLIRQNCGHGC